MDAFTKTTQGGEPASFEELIDDVIRFSVEAMPEAIRRRDNGERHFSIELQVSIKACYKSWTNRPFDPNLTELVNLFYQFLGPPVMEYVSRRYAMRFEAYALRSTPPDDPRWSIMLYRIAVY